MTVKRDYGGLFEHVHRGDPIRMRAETYNALMDMAREYFGGRRDRLGPTAPVPVGPEDSVNVLMLNTTGADQAQFAILGVGAPLVLPADSLGTFAERRAMKGILPAADAPFVVLQRPCANNAIARAVTAGITPCKLNVVDAAHKFAGPTGGDTTQLTTALTGPAEILWKDNGVGGSIWGVVRICCNDGTKDCCPGFLGDPKVGAGMPAAGCATDCGCGGSGGSGCNCGGSTTGSTGGQPPPTGGQPPPPPPPTTLMDDCCTILGSTPPPCPAPTPGTCCYYLLGHFCRASITEEIYFFKSYQFRACYDAAGNLDLSTVAFLSIVDGGTVVSGTPPSEWYVTPYGPQVPCKIAGLEQELIRRSIPLLPAGEAVCALGSVGGGPVGDGGGFPAPGGGVGGGGLPWPGGGGTSQKVCQVVWNPSTLSYDAVNCFEWPLRATSGMPGGGDLGDGPLGGGGLGGGTQGVVVHSSQIFADTAGILQVAAAGGLASVVAFTTSSDVLRGDGTFGAAPGPGAPLTLTQGTLGNALLTLVSTATNDDPTETIYQNRVTTTDATPTTIHTFALNDNSVYFFKIHVVGRRTGGSGGSAGDACAFITTACYKRTSGGGATAITVSPNPSAIARDNINASVTTTASGNNMLVQVTGAINNSYTWHLEKFEVDGPLSS